MVNDVEVVNKTCCQVILMLRLDNTFRWKLVVIEAVAVSVQEAYAQAGNRLSKLTCLKSCSRVRI